MAHVPHHRIIRFAQMGTYELLCTEQRLLFHRYALQLNFEISDVVIALRYWFAGSVYDLVIDSFTDEYDNPNRHLFFRDIKLAEHIELKIAVIDMKGETIYVS